MTHEPRPLVAIERASGSVSEICLSGALSICPSSTFSVNDVFGVSNIYFITTDYDVETGYVCHVTIRGGEWSQQPVAVSFGI